MGCDLKSHLLRHHNGITTAVGCRVTLILAWTIHLLLNACDTGNGWLCNSAFLKGHGMRFGLYIQIVRILPPLLFFAVMMRFYTYMIVLYLISLTHNAVTTVRKNTSPQRRVQTFLFNSSRRMVSSKKQTQQFPNPTSLIPTNSTVPPHPFTASAKSNLRKSTAKTSYPDSPHAHPPCDHSSPRPSPTPHPFHPSQSQSRDSDTP